MGDLAFESVYKFPYWNYLNAIGLEPELRSFIRDGCLVMIIAMAADIFDGQSNQLIANIDDCLAKIRSLRSLLLEELLEDPKTEQLVNTACLAVETIKAGGRESQELSDAFQWVHEQYVKGYFSQRVESFE